MPIFIHLINHHRTDFVNTVEPGFKFNYNVKSSITVCILRTTLFTVDTV